MVVHSASTCWVASASWRVMVKLYFCRTSSVRSTCQHWLRFREPFGDVFVALLVAVDAGGSEGDVQEVGGELVSGCRTGGAEAAVVGVGAGDDVFDVRFLDALEQGFVVGLVDAALGVYYRGFDLVRVGVVVGERQLAEVTGPLADAATARCVGFVKGGVWLCPIPSRYWEGVVLIVSISAIVGLCGRLVDGLAVGSNKTFWEVLPLRIRTGCGIVRWRLGRLIGRGLVSDDICLSRGRTFCAFQFCFEKGPVPELFPDLGYISSGLC